MTATYRTAPEPTTKMPGGIPYIIGNEAAERFSFYGMKGILIIFMTQYLVFLEGSRPGDTMANAEATAKVHLFNSAVYFFPIFGALLSDIFIGKYRTILTLSVVYCLGHAALAVMGFQGVPYNWMVLGLILIAVGSGGIKPCVSAHVGDQFGKTNGHLLTKVFGWFYVSINAGSFASTLLTPWLLEWYGPHWAFGVPGVLMAIATVAFWMGRKVFIHVPPGGSQAFFGETFSREGLTAIGKLLIIYAFVAVFWALFDQMGSTWVLQAEDMDRRWLKITWLSSQISAVNPLLILVYVPLFQFVLYPLIDKVFPLTPMRKISIGLFVMVGAFAVVAVIQERIDSGEQPSIGWQILAYALLTASEVMVSITCLEFSYTQAPRKMKSVIMALFLLSVSAGNLFTAGVNSYIIIPNGLAPADDLVDSLQTTKSHIFSLTKKGGQLLKTPEGPYHLNFDSKNHPGLADIEVFYSLDGEIIEIKNSETENFQEGLSRIKGYWQENERLPLDEDGQKIINNLKDIYGNPLRYDLINSKIFLLSSTGPDATARTEDDINFKVNRLVETEKEKAMKESDDESSIFSWLRPETPWIDIRKAEKGKLEGASVAASEEEKPKDFSPKTSIGGGEKISGASYFWFFAQLMLVTAFLFVIVAWFYKPREYLQEEATA